VVGEIISCIIFVTVFFLSEIWSFGVLSWLRVGIAVVVLGVGRRWFGKGRLLLYEW
jgi:hypothetical protein